MAKSTQDKELRRRMGLPLDSEEGDQGGEDESSSDSSGANEDSNNQPAKPNEPIVPSKTEDEIALEVARRYNPNIQSLDELKPSEQVLTPEEKRKKRDTAVLQHALSTGLVDAETIQNFSRDTSQSPRSIVYADFREKKMAAGKTEEDVERLFRKKYGEDLDPNDPDDAEVIAEHNAAMVIESNRIIKAKYPKMHGLEAEYDSHVSNISAQQAKEQQTRILADQYRTGVHQLVTELSVMNNTVGDTQNGESMSIPFSASTEIIEQVKQEFLTENAMTPLIAMGYSEEVLKNALRFRISQLTEQARISHVATKYRDAAIEKLKIGRHNLSNEEIGAGSGTSEEEFVDHEARAMVGFGS